MGICGNTSELIHASCVAWENRGVLIVGPSGSGKSSLALELMSRGANLVADDKTEITVIQDELVATCPESIKGKIEARGVGILAAETTPRAYIRLVVDLEKHEQERLPERRTTNLLGIHVPMVRQPSNSHFPAAVLQYLKGERID